MQANKELSNYRLEKAVESLVAAKSLLVLEQYPTAASSSYFCVFHCIRSVLALNSVDFKKHSAVISYFRENYIKTGKLETKLSDIIGTLFKIRSQSDYEDFFIISKEDVAQQIKNAEYFLAQIKEYLKSQ